MWTDRESIMSLQAGALHGGRISPNEAGAAGAAGLRAFARVADLWHLSIAERMTLLGLSSRSTYFKWRKEPQVRLPRDTLERISYILGIYKALQLLLPDTRAADEWVRRPNEAAVFGGRSALDRMLSGNVADLYIVRQYLDAQRG
jgi:antitoxin Xre/MbcA/ParS-like protein